VSVPSPTAVTRPADERDTAITRPMAVSPTGRSTFGALARPPARGKNGLRFAQSFPSALEALRANKGRAVLTTLGIVIGVAAVIAIVALGQGSQAAVTDRLAGLGTNVLTISPGSTRSSGIRGGAGTDTSLKIEDADAIQSSIEGVAEISPIVQGSAQVIAGNQNWSTRIQGVRPSYQQIQNWSMETGGFFSDADDQGSRNVAVIGQTVASNLFSSSQAAIGKYIQVRNVPMVVVGVLATKGAGFGGDQDDVVFVPFNTARIRLFGATSLNSIALEAEQADQMTQMTTDIQRLLRARHKLANGAADDFTIRNNNSLVDTVTGVTQTMTLLLGGVAAVSLVVGGIGIMNIMLVSVTERTREIGIRMAIGARGSDILAQFLIEAVVLASLGGLVGIFFGGNYPRTGYQRAGRSWSGEGPATAREAARRSRPCLRAVARMVERLAEASAPQAEREPPMTLRWMTEGRRSRSEPLVVGSTHSLRSGQAARCRKTYRLSRWVR
jgi:putative ABC transport system permease protein